MMKINKGDRVEVLDEKISGLVIKIEGEAATLLTSDGFEFDFPKKDLIKIPESDSIRVDTASLALAAKEKQYPQPPKGGYKKGKLPTKKQKRNLPAMEVDLHIHELTSTTRGMQNFDMLNLQLDTAKRKLDFAIKKRIQKIVFIHGVGEGVLRAELERLFRSYDNLEFYDADFKRYGLGATEVRIFQNS